ncbi:MAG: SDR family oxidoreductase [Rhodospirillaceae bacterium]|jgi:NAD(P)-dependent dehydrogenase (short-subunit alcohol dehydrogenase family)|nr:SDR family oxidoreductase [Rhodospirillaceae bacterium]MBT3909482.1 SDR family oxidoreductase [Rhodospirillaceae bacterium]MBT5299397.1 SDR family oxidoreductase [Rhodospirillaceae bacterium]MBT5515461.1 SDR family oxidoreductase [Rhodospirillaceae bacterium]MBT6086476.1 SDR family oxidoreductase [Rhodospirillaceae bacterium]
MPKLFDLTGKTALITGSSRGIGKAIAMAMVDAGARVVISSRKLDACEAVAAEINDAGGEAMALPCNVSDRDSLRTLVGEVIDAWGRIDILVCNAAINPYFGTLQDIDEGAFDKIMETNVKNQLWLCNMVIPAMAERREGSVIIVSSVGAMKGTKNLGAYSISKGADITIARNLAVEWGESQVTVNCIAPALIRTDMARALWEDPERYKKACEIYPLGRIGEPEEVAGAAVFLAAPSGRFVTGQTIIVDGGADASRGTYS